MYIIILSFIGLACLLVWYLLHHDHGRKLPVEVLWVAAGFGLLALIAAGLLEFVILPKTLLTAPLTIPLGQRFLSFMLVGILEELVKFIPLALFIRHKVYFK